MKTKKGNWIVECENREQTCDVLNYFGKNKDRSWYYWRYVYYISENGYIDIFKNLEYTKEYFPNTELISFADWDKLPNEESKSMPHINIGTISRLPKEKELTSEILRVDDKELIGWKLKKEEYRKAAVLIAYRNSKELNFTNYEGKYNFFKGSIVEERLKQAGVLELWFTPVYKEEKFVLPEKYCVKNNKHKELIDYANKHGVMPPYYISNNYYYHFPSHKNCTSKEKPHYPEITFEQFKEHVLNKKAIKLSFGELTQGDIKQLKKALK